MTVPRHAQPDRPVDHRRNLLQIYAAALRRVEGCAAVRDQWLPAEPEGEYSLVAIGKAAWSMCQGALERPDARIVDGLLITKTGHGPPLPPAGIRCIEAGHPLPDHRSLAAGDALEEFLLGLPPRRPLLVLLSGGASALVERLPADIELTDLQRINQWLVGSGLEIGEVNRIRKRLSLIKGGGLWQWIGQRPVEALLISDVQGDDPRDIGSGLLFGDTRPLTAQLPAWLTPLLNGAPEKPAAPGEGFSWKIVASLASARQAAARRARDLGYDVHDHADFLCGDAAAAGRRIASELMQGAAGIHIWGGETTVKLPPHPGRGGRAQHLALAAACELAGDAPCWLLAAGTDGSDGPGDDAGALVDSQTLERAALDGFAAGQALQRADAGTLLAAAGDLLATGPTGTNVMDLVLGVKP